MNLVPSLKDSRAGCIAKITSCEIQEILNTERISDFFGMVCNSSLKAENVPVKQEDFYLLPRPCGSCPQPNTVEMVSSEIRKGRATFP